MNKIWTMSLTFREAVYKEQMLGLNLSPNKSMLSCWYHRKKWESSHLTLVCKYLFQSLWKSTAAQKTRRTHSYLGLLAFVNYLFWLLGTLFLALANCRFSDLWFQGKMLPRTEYWVQQHKAEGNGQAQDMKIFVSPIFKGWMNTEQSFCTITWSSAHFSPCLNISSAQQWVQ